MTDAYLQRFAGVGRLYGRAGLERLAAASVAVIGLGGVGSWAVEALARSGVGALTLVDGDDVCVSNTNRQLQALAGNSGRPKAETLRERVLAINPECRVTAIARFFTAATADAILGEVGDGSAGNTAGDGVAGDATGAGAGGARFDAVVDAIDALSNKCQLVAACAARKIFVVSSGGCAGKRDATRVRVTDMVESASDNLLRFVRKELRRKHGFPRPRSRSGKRPVPFGVPCVWSPEISAGEPSGTCATGSGQEGVASGRGGVDSGQWSVVSGQAEVGSGQGAVGSDLPAPLPGTISPKDALRPNCEWGYGTACFVSGAFGFAAAGVVINHIVARYR
ncbi:MAG: tRNA threonylcarbamoyladenosine dehydratase [Puniceicoccales bacterium]|jgi:tRNA A37 threonylcarbamoyladenosine dehydratase|nr:tRNA threonylcarbamoyladenosine dehydratase [Puniceicoccales bacterium]